MSYERILVKNGAFVGKGLAAALMAVAAFVVVAAPAAWAAATFAPKTDFGAGDQPFSVAAADLDGDGDPDLATANQNSSNVSVLINDGDGAFAPKTDFGAGDGPVSVAAADLDGDGDPDLATANLFSDNVSVLINTTPNADLAITKSDSPDPVKVNEDLTYTLSVTNRGPDDATNVVVRDWLPDGVSFVSASPTRGSCAESSGRVTCQLGEMANGEQAAVEIVVQPAQEEGSISNTAAVGSDLIDPNPTNNADAERTEVTLNRAPVAHGDTYLTELDTELTVDAPGVLADDTDSDGDPLTAVLVEGPTDGTLTLNSDGSFTYTPDEGFLGTDSFTYKANDGTTDSNEATVAITVRDPRECTIRGTEGADSLSGTSGEDVICGLGGNDRIYGLGGNDTLFGDEGRDILIGGPGDDTLFGGEGDDTLNGFDRVRGNDALDGEGGTDTCRADQGDTRTNCER